PQGRGHAARSRAGGRAAGCGAHRGGRGLRNTSWHPRASRLSPTGSDPGHSAARFVWVDGELLPAESPALSLLDRGLRDGEGLFETLGVYGRRPFLWQRHMERLVLSSAELKFPVMPSPQRLEGALAEVLDRKSTRLNSSHVAISYAVFCLKKK